MQSLGSHLRELRERRGVSLEEMSRITRVAVRYLAALEADDHGALPVPVFTRGFIRAYCQVLREPPAEALALYPGGDSTRTTATHVPTDGRPAPVVARGQAASRGTVFVSFVLLVVFGLGLFGLTLVLQAGREDGVERRPSAPPAMGSLEERPAPAGPTPAADSSPAATASTPVPITPSASPSTRAVDTPPPGSPDTVPPVARAGDGTQRSAGATTATPTTTTGPAAPATAPTAAAPPAPSSTTGPNASPPGSPAELARLVASVSSPYRLVARASEPTWVRVRMGDGRAVEETMGANEVREWVSNQPFVLTIGNAGGLTLELNGRALPSLGPRGGVVGRIVIPPPSDTGPSAAKPAPGQ
jgi:cytoskeleton protein RodZ